MSKDQIIQSDEEEHKLYSTLHPCSLSLRIRTFIDSKDYAQFIKNVERTIRHSSEYKSWRDYITQVLQVNMCSVSKETIEDCSIEIHHHIPSLFILVKTVIDKFIDGGKPFCTFDICTECIELHFRNKIGFVPLISSLHEKFHHGKLEIPASKIMGDYKWLLGNYPFDQEDLTTLKSRLQVKEVSGCDWSRGNYPGVQSKIPDRLQIVGG